MCMTYETWFQWLVLREIETSALIPQRPVRNITVGRCWDAMYKLRAGSAGT